MDIINQSVFLDPHDIEILEELTDRMPPRQTTVSRMAEWLELTLEGWTRFDKYLDRVAHTVVVAYRNALPLPEWQRSEQPLPLEFMH